MVMLGGFAHIDLIVNSLMHKLASLHTKFLAPARERVTDPQCLVFTDTGSLLADYDIRIASMMGYTD